MRNMDHLWRLRRSWAGVEGGVGGDEREARGSRTYCCDGDVCLSVRIGEDVATRCREFTERVRRESDRMGLDLEALGRSCEQEVEARGARKTLCSGLLHGQQPRNAGQKVRRVAWVWC